MRDTAMTPDLKPEPFAWHYKNRTGWQQGYSARPPVDAIAAPDSGWTVNPLYTQDQLDAAVRAARNEILDELRTISETYCYAPGIKMTTSIAATLASLTAENKRLKSAGKNVMALIGGYPEQVPNELGMSAWRSVRADFLDAFANAPIASAIRARGE